MSLRSAATVLISALVLASSLALAQGASESLEREARSAFKSGRFKEAAIKFQDAAAAAAEPSRRAKMELQAAYSHFNDKNQRAAREALRRALTADPELEIVPEFFAPDFVTLVGETRRTFKAAVPPTPIDLPELKRVSQEKLKDGHPEEVVYDLTNVPSGSLDKEAMEILARAYEALGRAGEAAAARRGSTGAPASAPTTAPPSPSGRDTASLFAAGRQALAAGDALSAQTAARKALEIDPNSAEAYRLLGDTFLARGERAMAEANWLQALRYDPKNELSLLSLFDFYTADKKQDAAIDALQKAAALNPRNGATLVALARKLRAEGDVPHARQAFAAAVSAAPADSTLLTEYAAMLLDKGDVDAAIEELEKAAALPPPQPAAHVNLALAYRRKELTTEAEREYRETLRIDAGYVPALLGLGNLLMASGTRSGFAEAAELFRKALAKEPKNAEAIVGLARAQRLNLDMAGAQATLDAASDVEDADVWNEAGTVAYEQGKYQDAFKLFERALVKDPTMGAARTNREKAWTAARYMEAVAATPPIAAPFKK